MSIAVRIVHTAPDQVVAATVARYVIDQVPSSVPLWDPFDFSSLAQSQCILERLHVQKAALVIEVGYSLLDEGSTLTPRPQVQGDDSLGWYLFGSGHGTGLIPLFVDRSCVRGGSCWLSLIALGKHNRVVDLVAPYLPHHSNAGEGATQDVGQKGGRHHSGAATMMFTSSRALHVFLTTKLLSSVSFQKKRATLSFVVTASNSAGEYLSVLIANELHHHAVLDVVFPKTNAEHAPAIPKAGDPAGGLSQKDAIKGVVSAFEDRSRQVASLLAAPMKVEPFLIVRVPRSCQSDTLGVVDLLLHASSIPGAPKSEVLELSAASSTGIATPLPQSESGGAAFLEVSQWQQRVDECRQSLVELEGDLQDVLRATEHIAVEHHNVHEGIQLSRQELESAEAAIGALDDHNQSLRHDIKRLKASRDALRASEQAMTETKAVADAESFKTAESERRELLEMTTRHTQRLQQLRRDHEQKLTMLKATHDSKSSSIQREQQRALDELKATIHHADENIALSIQNGRRLEADVAQRQEQLNAIQKQIRVLDGKNQTLREGLIHLRQHSAKRQLCLDEVKHVHAATQDLSSQLQRQESKISLLETEKQRLTSELRREQTDAAEANRAFLALVKRQDAMQRSAMLAESQAGREALYCEEQDQWHGIRRSAIAATKLFQDHMLVLSSERAMAEVLDSIATAQAQEAHVLEETDAFENDVKSLHAALESAMATQERQLAVMADECDQTLLRIEQLRKLQRSKFLEREEELKSLRQTYQQLFQEFLAQIEDETTMALRNVSVSTKPIVVQDATRDAHGKVAIRGSTTTSRTASPAPSDPSAMAATSATKGQSALTRRNLANHRGGVAEHEVSHWDSCVLLYLQWSGEMAKNRDIDAETRRMEHKLARTEAASLSVAESLAIERQRLADVEAELARTALVDVEAKDALDEFVAKAAEQRQQMEDAVAGLLQDSQSSFKQMVEHVNAVQGRIKTLEASINAAQTASGQLAYEIEGLKSSNVDVLERTLRVQVERTQALEARLTALRQQQRADLGLTPGFYSLEEKTMRAMGIPSMRDPDCLFQPSLMQRQGSAPPQPQLAANDDGRDVNDSSEGRDSSEGAPPLSVAATQATAIDETNGRSDSVAGTRASSSIGTASYVGESRQSTRPSTPPSSVFYFGSADIPSGTPSVSSKPTSYEERMGP